MSAYNEPEQKQNSYVLSGRTSPVERDPDGLCNLLSQATDRLTNLNECLGKLSEQLGPVLTPEPPTSIARGTNDGSVPVNAQSHAHDVLYEMLYKISQADQRISSIAGRFRA